jgi:hypothetical protein
MMQGHARRVAPPPSPLITINPSATARSMQLLLLLQWFQVSLLIAVALVFYRRQQTRQSVAQVQR